MNKLILIIITLLLFSVHLSFSETCEEALEESNKLLERASEVITSLKDENKELKAENDRLKDGSEVSKVKQENIELQGKVDMLSMLLAESNVALDESNLLLEKAYDRIEKDGVEIKELRKHIDTLIKSGVEIKTYDWNIIITSGYPLSIGLAVAYNLPFFTNLGFLVGIDYNIDNNIPAVKAGIKLNLGK